MLTSSSPPALYNKTLAQRRGVVGLARGIKALATKTANQSSIPNIHKAERTTPTSCLHLHMQCHGTRERVATHMHKQANKQTHENMYVGLASSSAGRYVSNTQGALGSIPRTGLGWYTPVISALWGWRPEDPKFQGCPQLHSETLSQNRVYRWYIRLYPSVCEHV